MTGTEGQCATKAWYHCVLMALLALLILLFMAVLISGRFMRTIFKSSAMGTFREEA